MTIKFPLQRFTVHGNSMLPTLKPGQNVLVWKWFGKTKVGDMVVIKKNDKEMVKRVQEVQGHEYFVQGDNKKESTDSRKFGWVKKEEIIGKVIWFQ